MSYPSVRIDYTPRTLPKQEAAAHNTAQIQRMVRICKTLDALIDLSIELSGHLSTEAHHKFRDEAIDAWYAYNVSEMCEAVAQSIREAQ